MASYRLPYADGDKHLKIAMVRPKKEAKNYEDVRRGAMGEAERARWAGDRGLGPKVHYTHAPLGAFVSDFVDGRIPSLQESRGPLLDTNLRALAQLHRQEVNHIPDGGQLNWLNEGPRVRSDLDAAHAPARPAAFRHALLHIEAGLEHFRARAPYVPVPIHDDYKPDNTLLCGEKLFLLDWNNLRAADAAIDLGHFAVMVDLSAGQVATSYVDRYLAIQQQSGTPVADEAQIRTSSKAYTGLFRLRSVAFYDQWTGTRPRSEYLLNRLAADVDAMRHDIFRELDLRPAALQDAR